MQFKKIINFYKNLNLDIPLPDGIQVMNPYKDPETIGIVEAFARKYFDDDHPRTMIFGINPGRFGAGITGITFTDPIRLEKECWIPNSFPKKQELSSVFIYEMISRYGGPEKFYSKFFLSAVCPLGFVKKGRNLNFYDETVLEKAVKPFIIRSILQHLDFGANRKTAICLGEGENYKFFTKLNEEHKFFKKLIPLAHPRFIMQYRLKNKDNYLNRYLEILKNE